MKRTPELVIALDLDAAAPALELAARLRRGEPRLTWFKVGFELFTAAGPDVVARLRELGCRVFLDLKFYDIPATAKKAVKAAATMGAGIVDMHLSGGRSMLDAALEGRDAASIAGEKPLLLGVSVLTSMSAQDMSFFRIADPALAALELADLGRKAGLDGVVCSGHEASIMKERFGPSWICLTPGIRPAGPDRPQADDQRRVMTPAQAVAAGSDFLVVGRPVAQAPSPVDAARAIIDEMESVRAAAPDR